MKLTIAASAFGLALAIAAPATATTIVAQFNGVITSGVDDNGFFGTAGADLTGAAVTAIFTVDTQNGASTFTPPQWSEAFGGGFFGTDSPVSAEVQINGDSFILTGTYDGEALQFAPSSGKSGVSYSVDDRNAFDGGYTDYSMSDGASSTTDSFVTSYDYRSPPAIIPTGDLLAGAFGVSSYDSSTGQFTLTDQLQWSPSSVSFQVLSDVPEPRTWALMLGGLASVGAAVRSRRRLA